jgi:general secretion pathway protein D
LRDDEVRRKGIRVSNKHVSPQRLNVILNSVYGNGCFTESQKKQYTLLGIMLCLIASVALAALIAPHAVAQTPAQAVEKPGRDTSRDQGVTLNLQNVDIDAASRALAAVLGRPVVVDPRVKGQITLVTEGPVTRDKALAQFGASLRAHGFAMVESSGVVKVVPEADAKLQGGSVVTGGPGVQPRGEQIITQIIKLNYENAANLVPILRPLIAPNNTINANVNTNSLVITDYASNLRTIARIVAALDVPNATDLEVIALKHAVASDIAGTVARLVDSGAQAGVPPGSGGGQILADVRTNSLMVRAANPARMALVKALVEKLDQPSGGGNLHVVYLKNAQADKLAEILRNLLSGQSGTVGTRSDAPLSAAPGAGGAGQRAGATVGGPIPATPAAAPGAGNVQVATVANSGIGGSSTTSIQADLASNALIITAPEPLYRQLRGVIDQLDSRRAQVYIEALVAEVSNSKLDELGVQWQAIQRSNDNRGVYLGTNLPRSGASLLGLQAAAATGDASAAAGAIGDLRGLNFAVIRRIGNVVTIPALARALESVGGSNILSTPNILALDNEEAKFSSGQNVPFVTGQFTNTGAGGGGAVNPFQTIERKDVGIQLRVRPQISEGGTIKLQIYLEVSSVAEGSGAQGIITNKSSIENAIIVDDGQMIALGGLLKDGFTQSQDKVPLLGDIPVLGTLFRYERRNREKVNLMIFLRPVVIRDSAAASTLLQDRYELMRGITRENQPDSRLFDNDSAAPVLPPLPPPTQPGERKPTPAQPAPVPPQGSEEKK